LQGNLLSRPIVLHPLDLNEAVDVVEGQAVMVTSPSASGVALEIPSDAEVTFPDGSHTGKMSLATLPAEYATTAPPQYAEPLDVIALEPSGTRFSKRVKMRIPNFNELPEG